MTSQANVIGGLHRMVRGWIRKYGDKPNRIMIPISSRYQLKSEFLKFLDFPNLGDSDKRDKFMGIPIIYTYDEEVAVGFVDSIIYDDGKDFEGR